MSDRVVIDRRFNGPPDSGHGGYVCGVLGRIVDGPAEVTLRRPPPLVTPLTVALAADGTAVLVDGPVLVADARPVARWEPDPPTPPDLATAVAAGRATPARDPRRHPQPLCFGCGTGRAADDGLRIVPGLVSGVALVADVWVPDASVVDAAGQVGEEFVWAALDCPSGFAGLAWASCRRCCWAVEARCSSRRYRSVSRLCAPAGCSTGRGAS